MEGRKSHASGETNRRERERERALLFDRRNLNKWGPQLYRGDRALRRSKGSDFVILVRRDFGTARLMERGGEIEEEPQRVFEDKIFVAVGKNVKESILNLKWVLQNSGGQKICFLHVHQPAQMIPMRTEFTQPVELGAPVQAEKLDIEMDNIEKGIVELIAQHEIRKLVMGAAADKHYSKKMTEPKSKKAIFVQQQAHFSCPIWFVCKGNLIYMREGTSDGTEIEGTSPSLVASPITGTGQSGHLRPRSVAQGQGNCVRFASPVQDFPSPRYVNFESRGRNDTLLSSPVGTRGIPMPQIRLGAEGSADECEGISRRSPSQGSAHSTWFSSEVFGTSDSISVVRDGGSEDGSVLPSVHEYKEDLHSTSPPNMLEKGRLNDELYDQLEQAMVEAENSKREAFAESVRRRNSEKDSIDAIRKAKASESLYRKEMKLRKEMEEMLAREKQEVEKKKNLQSEVMEDLQMVQDQKSVLDSRIAESNRMIEELEEKIVSGMELLKTLNEQQDVLLIDCDNAVNESEDVRESGEEEASSSHRLRYFSEFSILEIKEATCNFDPLKKIGEGGYGSVYRGLLRNTQVAIKILHSHSLQGHAEFQQEVDVLSMVRHPNLVTLIGACPEVCSLIYEYLPNGSLEDRLACLDGTLPLSWQTRTRIATEICSALIFLHSNNPHSIVHGDLKPANILLDANLVSKLGDFGICRMLRDINSSNTTTLCHRTDPKGTFVYMDPEFSATGELTLKSDVYSFGVILLRLLTGRPPLGIVKEVQYALEKGNLNALLDATAGNWPSEQAKELAHLGLRCCEMNRRNRPDLESEEITWDTHIVADGFTYEAEALKGWLDSDHDTSP
ncbi:hypothetical protein HHK36_000210 [Tetracentron sinense]|uniref:RING-type E3 ubiquitin transferase n=1 Tax=Tetracentron sinense TaxID=13715 RepID=A0A834ZRI9_TETSI|nr:hypothetical protein HHK36_000210 [Tetracentron sinense]